MYDMKITNSFSRSLRVDDYDEDEIATVVDDRTATLKDGTKLRITPPGQKTVGELIRPGDIIWHVYEWGESKGRVIEVSKHAVYGLETWSIVFVDLDAKPSKYGVFRSEDHCFDNELVAHDGKILPLFVDGEDETFFEQDPQGRELFLKYEELRKTQPPKPKKKVKIVISDGHKFVWGDPFISVSVSGPTYGMGWPCTSNEEVQRAIEHGKEVILREGHLPVIVDERKPVTLLDWARKLEVLSS